jgi:hypothetical protein
MDNLINELLIPCKYINIIDKIGKINNDSNNSSEDCIITILSKIRKNNVVYNIEKAILYLVSKSKSTTLGIYTLNILTHQNSIRFIIQRYSDTLNSIEYDENIKSIKLYTNNQLIYYEKIDDMEIKNLIYLENEKVIRIKAILISFNDIPLISCSFHQIEMEIEYFKPNLNNSIKIIGGFVDKIKRKNLVEINYDLDLQNGIFIRFQQGISIEINIDKNLINEAHKESIRRKNLNF